MLNQERIENLTQNAEQTLTEMTKLAEHSTTVKESLEDYTLNVKVQLESDIMEVVRENFDAFDTAEDVSAEADKTIAAVEGLKGDNTDIAESLSNVVTSVKSALLTKLMGLLANTSDA